MSVNVLVIPEDPTQNGYILRPVVERICDEAGKPNAKIKVLTNPRTQGYDSAVAAIRNQLVLPYGHFDLWIFVPDADRARNLDELEAEMGRQKVRLFCAAAQPELEAWLLAGYAKDLPISWTEVRDHRRLKEEVFDPFLRQHGDLAQVGKGREALMRAALSEYKGLKSRCPEIASLEARCRAHFAVGNS